MRICTICQHAKQAEIDQQLVAGTSLRNVAKQFETSATALFRHKRHLANHLVKAAEAADIADAGTLLDQVKRLLSDTQRLTAQAEQAKQLDVALRGIREIRGVLELLGKVSGELQQAGTQIAIGINGQPLSPEERMRQILDEIMADESEPGTIDWLPEYRSTTIEERR